RDRTVTGVQTCALPILSPLFTDTAVRFGLFVAAWLRFARTRVARTLSLDHFEDALHAAGSVTWDGAQILVGALFRELDGERGGRSEERRVGKEWRTWLA